MVWYMNFCTPFIPNDATIQFFRYVQASFLAAYMLAYIFIHTYYKFCGPTPLKEDDSQKEDSLEGKSDKISSDQNSSHNSDKDQLSMKLDKDKLDEEQPNDSCVEFKKTVSTAWERSTRNSKKRSVTQDSQIDQKTDAIEENVTLAEVQEYFPVVYGHFAVALGACIMYSPFAEQTLAALLYMLLTIPLLIANAKRYFKTTILFWIYGQSCAQQQSSSQLQPFWKQAKATGIEYTKLALPISIHHYMTHDSFTLNIALFIQQIVVSLIFSIHLIIDQSQEKVFQLIIP